MTHPARHFCPTRLLLYPFLIGMMAIPAAASAQSGGDTPRTGEEAKATETDPEIRFAATDVQFDSDNDIVTASGDVVMRRDGYQLFADTVIWNRQSGEITAKGNIRSIGPDGDVAYGDSIALNESLKDGIVENLLVVMADGERLAAHSGKRVDGRYELDYAAYTPCLVEGPDGCPKNPSWQVRAVRVKYDPAKKRVRYYGARIELFGLPLIPLPGLSHPAETQAGSGFIVPNISFSRNNGVELEIPYYFRLSPNRDLTVSTTLFSDVAPLVRGKFRSFEKKGAIELNAYGTYGTRVSTGPTNPESSEEFRGYFDAVSKFQLNPNWSTSTSIRVATDRTFLRRYDISRDDRLRSTFNVERIDTDSYFAISGWAVQTLRVGDRQGLTPIALPEIDYRLRLSNPVLGGKVQIQANSLAITRTSGQDTQRAFASARWDLRRITPLGQEIGLTILGRGDIYHSDENADTLTPVYRGETGWQGRGILAGAVDVKWPFVGQIFGGTQVFTPRIQLAATPAASNLRLPNEDSRAVDLEDSNIFALNRFSGYDRFEDNYRVTYGFDWSYRGGDIAAEFNIGQSYRLSNRETIFPDGTGLSGKTSDIVGRGEIRFKDVVKFAHRFRLDKDSLAVRRNEIDATVGSRSTYAQVGYLRLNRDIATVEDLADREELRLAGRLKLARYWSVFGSTIIDITSRKEDPLVTSDGFEPIRHRVGVAYDDDCLSLAFTWRRDYERTGDARRGNSFLFKLAFRHLGV